MFPLGVLAGGEALNALNIQFNGLPFYDAAGNHPLTYPAGVTESSGKAVFNNVAANYIKVDRSSYRLQSSIEVICKINLTSNGTLQSVWTMLNAAGDQVFRLFIAADGSIGFYMGDYTGLAYFAYSWGSSVELKVIYDKAAGELKLYKDGALIGTVVSVGVQVNVKRDLRIGNYTAANPFPMNGQMDYLTIAEF